MSRFPPRNPPDNAFSWSCCNCVCNFNLSTLYQVAILWSCLFVCLSVCLFVDKYVSTWSCLFVSSSSRHLDLHLSLSPSTFWHRSSSLRLRELRKLLAHTQPHRHRDTLTTSHKHTDTLTQKHRHPHTVTQTPSHKHRDTLTQTHRRLCSKKYLSAWKGSPVQVLFLLSPALLGRDLEIWI